MTWLTKSANLHPRFTSGRRLQTIKHLQRRRSGDRRRVSYFCPTHAIELHGGLITVDSEEDVYTEFTVLLPRNERAPRGVAERPSPQVIRRSESEAPPK